uniref:Cyclic GMP-AMP synthase n=1 Tax=Nothoprocta perdicaria TaxID=30464 RepID=A0A8C6ZRN2_NOTPE
EEREAVSARGGRARGARGARSPARAAGRGAGRAGPPCSGGRRGRRRGRTRRPARPARARGGPCRCRRRTGCRRAPLGGAGAVSAGPAPRPAPPAPLRAPRYRWCRCGGARGRGGAFGGLERLSAGSYYEHVKVGAPDEFDIMLTLPVPPLQLDACDDTGAFYYATLKRNPKEMYLSRFLDEEGKLSAFKMLEALRKIIKEEVKNIKVTVTRKKVGCPAITLQIQKPPSEISVDIILALKVHHSWPLSTKDGLPVGEWLGTKVRKNLRYQDFYLVAKQNKEEKVLRGISPTDNKPVLWRTEIITNHGNGKTCCESDGVRCCRKDCLKLLKYLLQQLKTKHQKELQKFCSYHAKTAFFHSCAMWPRDEDWRWEDLDRCFHRYLEYFLDCLQKSRLPHFFIPQYNLLSQNDRASQDFLIREINYQINNRFPIFLQDN